MQLSFVSTSLTQLIFAMVQQTAARAVNTEAVLRELDIHWYKPQKMTSGLMVPYLRALITRRLFSANILEKTNSHNIKQTFEENNAHTLDEAA